MTPDVNFRTQLVRSVGDAGFEPATIKSNSDPIRSQLSNGLTDRVARCGTSREPGETWSRNGNGLRVSILHERTMVSSTSCSIAQTIAQARAIVLYTIALFSGDLCLKFPSKMRLSPR